MRTNANDDPQKNWLTTRRQFGDGFTLIELLVVVAIIAVLAGMLLTAVAKGKSTTQSIACLNNLRQLAMGWSMYAHDHDDSLPPNKLASWNFDTICPEGYDNASGSWVLGNAMQNSDPWFIKNGILFPYNPSLAVYHCPADKSKVDAHPNLLRNRSYAMSYCMNGDKYLIAGQDKESFPLVKGKYSELSKPAGLFVFLDEADQAIGDGTFFIHYPGDQGEYNDGAHWMDVPADRHAQGCNLSFADCHSDRLSWRWPKKGLVNQRVANHSDWQDLRTLQRYIPETALAKWSFGEPTR